MKKIIKLTEADLVRLVKKVIEEQTSPSDKQGPKVPFKHSQTGDVYQAPYIQSDDDLSKFINFGEGGIVQTANLLKNFGIDLVPVATEENEAIKRGASPGKTTNFLYIHGAIVNLLKAVAKFNLDPKNLKILENNVLKAMDQVGIDKTYGQHLKMALENHGIDMKRFLDAMSKLVEYQKNKI